jgi:hypothetical protein
MAYKSGVLGVEQNQEKQSASLVTQSTQLKSKEPISFLANYKNKRSWINQIKKNLCAIFSFILPWVLSQIFSLNLECSFIVIFLRFLVFLHLYYEEVKASRL